MSLNEEIVDSKYIKKKLSALLDKINDKQIKENDVIKVIQETLSEIDTHLDNIKKDELYQYKINFLPIIDSLKEEITFNKSQAKPIKLDIKPFNERVYSKLNYVFRKNIILKESEMKKLYENVDLINKKYDLFLELINWLNDNGFSIIPEKTLFSAYLGISVETYNDILKNGNVESVRNIFKSIDEYLTTTQFGALINDDRKALERIQKIETYGQEMRQTQPDVYIDNRTQSISYSEIITDIRKKSQKLLNLNSNVIDHKE